MSKDHVFLRLPQVKQRTGLGRTEIYRRIARGEFPKQVRLGPRVAVWVEAEIDAWAKSATARRSEQREGFQPADGLPHEGVAANPKDVAKKPSGNTASVNLAVRQLQETITLANELMRRMRHLAADIPDEEFVRRKYARIRTDRILTTPEEAADLHNRLCRLASAIDKLNLESIEGQSPGDLIFDAIDVVHAIGTQNSAGRKIMRLSLSFDEDCE